MEEMEKKKEKNKKWGSKYNMWQSVSPMKLILGGYLAIILVGTILLMLPAATKGTGSTGLSDCFFTATSATCVTGLVRYDTFTHWTLFGQLVILALIQIGGIGFMTVAILVMVLTKRKIHLSQRSLMQNSISAPQIGGIVRMTKFIALGTLLIEGIGAVLLSFDFVPRFGFGKGIYFSLFHSVSAFCNGGFDLMGATTGEFSSLTGMIGSGYVCGVIMLLIFVGGLSFFVWHDLLTQRFRWKRLRLQSKMVLSISVSLVLLGAVAMALLEWNQAAYAGLSVGEKINAALFQSVSARTAGFNNIDLTKMSEGGIFVMICLMFVGGSTGSTAGGIKTTTFWILCISILVTFRRKKNIEMFGRRMEEGITRTASCVFMTYLLLSAAVSVIISALEGLPFLTALFESVSAVATVGLTLGVTPGLGMVSKLLLAFLMLCGRVGSITMLLAFSSEKRVTNSRLPLEKVQVG
ncbi:MAG: Trk family potassium uptake protein [Eubacterium sp.]|nr:Trk family potassium uptake protein [Eubacterium sp.]MCM1214270.1 Trk family potassium uptake protein [Lachnospiraceae bacterium]MCM1302578.1 Trk family potassium uptake protein [Butyrivibrio sp.]MCM1342293.1 Trk family potassium uptake protein [Muribaculaceae bacterium]MCM1238070.1 Trk family potassium uptake protein [Lachnospiraceae bacterium]